MDVPTPEHDKLAARRTEHDTIVDFVQWLDTADAAGPYNLARWDRRRGKFEAVSDRQRGDLIAAYFGVDRAAYDAETEALFAALREAANR